MSGILYIVATPIGNLEDITLRAISILSDVDYILAEDTRVTAKLLALLNSKVNPPAGGPKLISYHHHSQDNRKYEILKDLLDGKNIALVTDAGTPGISDPGNELIEFILENSNEIKVIPIPGVSALATIISISAFNMQEFSFLGFLPKKGRLNYLKKYLDLETPIIFYESPFRILKSLEDVKSVYGESVQIVVGREMTKMFESYYRGTVKEVVNKLKDLKKVKGELTVIVKVKN